MKKKFCCLQTLILIVALNVGFASCGSDDKDDVNVNTSPITLYAGDKTTVSGATSIETENEFVAFIGKSDNSVNGWHVGDTYIIVNGKNRIPVSVKGKYHTYNNPVTEWGCSQTHVKNLQTQGILCIVFASRFISTTCTYNGRKVPTWILSRVKKMKN